MGSRISTEQARVVSHPSDRHGTVLAVPGSGKSTTSVERIAYMVERERIDPAHVIAVMFNTGAASELKDKLERRLGKRNAPLSVTYHGLGTLTIKKLLKAGLIDDWKLEASPARAQRFTAGVIEQACYTRGFKYPRIVADVFLGFVDRIKSELMSPSETWKLGCWDAKYEWFVAMFPLFEQQRVLAKLRFFSDLIYDPVVMMQGNQAAAETIGGRYRQILIDEYQDISESQQALIRFNAGATARVMVVGDDDQTIYSWRGAKPSYILRDFDRDFPGGEQYTLTRTWRYGSALSCAANYVITHNTDRADKLCISGEGTFNTELVLEWEDAEGKALLKAVRGHVHSGGRLSGIAILVRTYSISAMSQFALLAAGIPFRLEGGDDVSVLQNRWVSCLIGWMNIAAGNLVRHPYAGEPDNGSVYELKRILDVPPIGLSYEGTNALVSTVLKQPAGMDGFARYISTQLAISDGALAAKINDRGRLWRKVRGLGDQVDAMGCSALLELLVNGLELDRAILRYSPSEDAAADQLAIVDAFKKYVNTNSIGRTVAEFLRHLDDLRSFSDKAKESTEALHMTSIHRSKGLEYPLVIMIGLSQGRFPLKPKQKLEGDRAIEHLEDERRLFFVGMTRAREKLIMMCPADAMLQQWLRAGRSGSPKQLADDGSDASQFLYESNLYLARTMPTMLERGLTLKAGNPEVYNRYLELLGRPERVGKLEG